MTHQIGMVGEGVSDVKSGTPNSERERLVHYDSLIRKLFYACEYCDGALIHLANCVVCKRATIRKCTHCNTELKISHSACDIPNGFENYSVDTALEVEK